MSLFFKKCLFGIVTLLAISLSIICIFLLIKKKILLAFITLLFGLLISPWGQKILLKMGMEDKKTILNIRSLVSTLSIPLMVFSIITFFGGTTEKIFNNNYTKKNDHPFDSKNNFIIGSSQASLLIPFKKDTSLDHIKKHKVKIIKSVMNPIDKKLYSTEIPHESEWTKEGLIIHTQNNKFFHTLTSGFSLTLILPNKSEFPFSISNCKDLLYRYNESKKIYERYRRPELKKGFYENLERSKKDLQKYRCLH